MATFPGFEQVSVHIKHINDPEPFVVTYGSVTDTTYDEQTLANNHFTVFANNWAPVLDNFTQIIKTVVHFGNTPPAPDDIYESTNAAVTGGLAASFLPQNCAALVRKRTAVGGRPNRGRLYMPSVLPEALVDGVGQIDPAKRTALQAVATQWLSDLEGGGAGEPESFMYILHTPDPVTGAALIPTPVTTLEVDAVIATQRRRLRR